AGHVHRQLLHLAATRLPPLQGAAPALRAVLVEPGDALVVRGEGELGDRLADLLGLFGPFGKDVKVTELLLRRGVADEGEVLAAGREAEGGHALADAPSPPRGVGQEEIAPAL